MRPLSIPVLLALLLATGCPVADDDDATPAPEPRIGPREIGPEDRPARVVRPASYDGVTLVPVVVALHGYQVDSYVLDAFFGLSDTVDETGILLVLPEALDDAQGNSRWNARGDEDAADDVAYLRAVIDDALTLWAGDPDRVFVTGHSNGAAMTYRMACEAADLLAGIVPVSGSPLRDPASCSPSRPLSMLHIHGTNDASNSYEGSDNELGAAESAERFAEYAGCDVEAAEAGAPLDLIRSLDGDETEVLDYRAGCTDGTRVSLWTMEGAPHSPAFRPTFARAFLPWLLE